MSPVYSRSRYFLISAIFVALFSLLGCGSSGSSSKSGSTQSHQPSDTPFSVRGDWAIMNGEIIKRSKPLSCRRLNIKLSLEDNEPGLLVLLTFPRQNI